MKTPPFRPSWLSAFIFSLTLPSPGSAPAQIPAPPQEQPVALIGATLHTWSDGVLENATLVFEEGRITALGRNVAIPAGARRVMLEGKHVFPGLVASDSTLGLYEIGMVDVTVDLEEYGRVNPNSRAEVAFHPDSEHLPVARSGGVLVSFSRPSGGLISGTSAAMMMDGWTWEEMLLKAPLALVVRWPPAQSSEYSRRLKELKEAFDDARAYWIAREAASRNEVPPHDSDARWQAMIPVLEGRVPVVVQAEELQQIQDALTWAEREEVRLVIAGGRDSWRAASRLREADVPVLVGSVLASPARTWEGYDGVYSLPAKLYEAGVRFAISGESSAAYANRIRYHAGAARVFGLPAEEALKAVSLYPARIFGLDDRIGSLQPGLDATFVVASGPPLEYSTVVEQAYIQGREVDMTDRHKRLFEKYRERYRRLETSSR